MHKCRLIILSILTLLTTLTGNAQINEAGLWSGLEIAQPIDKKMSVAYTQGLRWDNNITNLANALSQVKIGYKVTKSFKVTAGYRWSRKNSWRDQLNLENRFQLDLRYKFKIKDFSINHRVRMQSRYRNYLTSEFGYFPTNYVRNKTSLGYKIGKKAQVSAAFEFFNPYERGAFGIVDKVRYRIGGSYDLSDAFAVEAFYMIQDEINRSQPITSYITGIGLSLTLPKIKTKKKKKDKDDDKEKEEVLEEPEGL